MNARDFDAARSGLRHPLSRMLPKNPVGPMRAPARALGWLSIGLGAAELLMPRAFARAVGGLQLPALTRLYGMREIATGVGLLNSRDPAPWLWGRVAGDALDIVTLAPGLVTSGKPLRTLTSLVALGGIAYIDAQCAQGAAPRRAPASARDYGERSGFPRPPAEMRGLGRKPAREPGKAADGDADGATPPQARQMPVEGIA